MRTAAANAAARAAIGGDDMLSRWQLMAQQSKQKCDVGTDVAFGPHSGEEGTSMPVPSSGKNMGRDQEMEKRSLASHVSVSGKYYRYNLSYFPPEG